MAGKAKFRQIFSNELNPSQKHQAVDTVSSSPADWNPNVNIFNTAPKYTLKSDLIANINTW